MQQSAVIKQVIITTPWVTVFKPIHLIQPINVMKCLYSCPLTITPSCCLNISQYVSINFKPHFRGFSPLHKGSFNPLSTNNIHQELLGLTGLKGKNKKSCYQRSGVKRKWCTAVSVRCGCVLCSVSCSSSLRWGQIADKKDVLVAGWQVPSTKQNFPFFWPVIVKLQLAGGGTGGPTSWD